MRMFMYIFCSFVFVFAVHNAMCSEIEALLDRGESQVAMDLIERAMREGDSSSMLKVSQGRAYIQLGRVEEGERVLAEVRMNAGDDKAELSANLLLGKLYSQTNKMNAAQPMYEAALEKDSSSAAALAGLGKVFLVRDSDVEKAKEYMERAHRASPRDEMILFELGMVYFYSNEHVRGREAFDRAMQVNPSMDLALVGKVYLHYQHMDWAEEVLLAAYTKAQRGDGQPLTSDTVLLLAETQDFLGKAEAARELYEGVLVADPDNGLAHAALGLLLLGTGARNYGAVQACGLNSKEARQHLQRAVQLMPQISQAQEALDFCKSEMQEVMEWRRRAGEQDSGAEVGAGAGAGASRRWSSEHVLVGVVPSAVVSALAPMGLKIRALSRRLSGELSVRAQEALCGLVEVLGSTSLAKKCRRRVAAHSAASGSSSFKARKMEEAWSKRENHMQPMHEVHSAPSAEEFMKHFVKQNAPVVVRNGEWQPGWHRNVSGPHQESYSTFSAQHLRDSFGDSTVRVSLSETGRFDGPESGVLWGLDPKVDVLVRPPTTSMRFRDFMTLTAAGTVKETFYLEYLALHQYLGSSFLDLIPLPAAARTAQLEPLVTNLWIGTRPTTSPLHYDDYENLLCQIRGRKEVVLYPPSDIDLLYYVGRPKGKLVYEYPSKFTRDPATVQRGSFVFGSSVNMDKPDSLRFPKYKRATAFRVVLHPGDVLYLPAYWHHEVQSLPDEEGMNMAVNFWFKNVTFPIDDMAALQMK